MKDGLGKASNGENGEEWNVLAERLVASYGTEEQEKLPFATFSESIREDMEPAELRSVYLRLYRKACAASGAGDGPSDEELLSRPDGVEAVISYNMAITRNAMVICPRTAEGAAVVDKDGQEVGKVALNGTVLAGTALVKSEPEWDALRADPAQLWNVLGKIGIKPSL